MAKRSYDAIVVGAGFGGAACASLLAKRGLEVLLLEKNAKAGGKAMAFSKRGFTYTPWVVITAPINDNAFEIVLRELGMEGEVELVTPDSGGGAVYKNTRGQYMPMPKMPHSGASLVPSRLTRWSPPARASPSRRGSAAEGSH